MGHVSSSFFRQPKAVWATAFAAVVGFMSIGLVDPILVSIAAGLHASPSQVSLLFSSYFAVTAAMMLVTGFVSSRIGGRNTLLLGTALVCIFAALSGTSDSVSQLVLYRAGWGLGNAFFVATALSVIVAVANGGTMTAILLYEAALGLGLSVGPLLGAALGSLSWRFPFYGTASLMLIGLLAIAKFLDKQPLPAKKTSLSAPIRALAHRGLATTAVSAFFYNYAFFTVLAFVPFALKMSAHAVGLIFFGWGVMLALFSVIVAPRLQARFSAMSLLSCTLGLLALVLVGMALGSATTIIVGVVIAGALMGINNTVYTEMALDISETPRPVASAAYNFVRWFAGVIAPYAAPKIGEHWGAAASFSVAAAAALLAPLVLYIMRDSLGRFGKPQATEPSPNTATGKILLALDGSAQDALILRQAGQLARDSGAILHLLHIVEIEVFDEYAASAESRSQAETVLANAIHSLRELGITADGDILEESAALAPKVFVDTAQKLKASMILIGKRHAGDLGDAVHGSFAQTVKHLAKITVLQVDS